MAPEIKVHFRDGTKPVRHEDISVDMKQDIYSVGLILYELCHKMRTHMERNRVFRALTENREINA